MPLAALRIEDEGERYFEHFGHLERVGRQRCRRRDQADHRRHLEAGAGHVGIEPADGRDKSAGEPDLFLRFAQRRGERIGVAGLDTPAREADLAGMVLQMIGAPRQQHGEAFWPFDQRHQHGGPRQRAIRQQVGVEIVVAAAQARRRGGRQAGEDVVPVHAAGSQRPSGKNCSLLHTP